MGVFINIEHGDNHKYISSWWPCVAICIIDCLENDTIHIYAEMWSEMYRGSNFVVGEVDLFGVN